MADAPLATANVFAEAGMPSEETALSYPPAGDSAMTYRELVVTGAITNGPHAKCSTMPDIRVEPLASVRSGREIWAAPKKLCAFTHTGLSAGYGPKCGTMQATARVLPFLAT